LIRLLPITGYVSVTPSVARAALLRSPLARSGAKNVSLRFARRRL